jgi:hypothetical protein
VRLPTSQNPPLRAVPFFGEDCPFPLDIQETEIAP